MYQAKYSIFIFTLIMLLSCGDDDSCTADDWAGIWSGMVECDDQTSESVTIEITKVDDNTISLSYLGETFNIDIDGCSYRTTEVVDIGLGSIAVDFDGELSGTTLDFSTSISLLGQELSCSGVLNKS